MSREKSFLLMLEAAAVMQKQIAIILESKAFESEKARNWVCGYMRDEAFAEYGSQLKQSLEIHDQMVELIEGLTKMEVSLAKSLKVVLDEHEDSTSNSLTGMGGMFDFGGAEG